MIQKNAKKNIIKHSSLWWVVVILLISVTTTETLAQKPPKNIETEKAVIKTSAVCQMCKKKIEAKVNALEGVQKAVLSLGNRQLKVTYNPEKISVQTIRKTIASLGYDADDIKADPVAVEKLPACCKPGKKKDK